MNDLVLKTIDLTIDDTNENEFGLQLYQLIKDKYKLKAMTDKYSTVDFNLLPRGGGSNIYLELKCRSIHSGFVDTFFIGKTKIDKIELHYPNTYIVWKFNEKLYWTKYNASFREQPKQLIRGSLVYLIPKKYCSIGIQSLADKLLNNNNI